MKIEIGGEAGDGTAQEGYVQVDAFGACDVRGDLRALPLRPGAVEEIYASHVFEHLPNAQVVPALRECRRALGREGVLVAYVPDFGWHLRRFLRERDYATRWALHHDFIFGSQEHEGQYHRTGFSSKRLADMLTMAGFRQIAVKRVKRQERARGGWKPMELRAEARP